MKKTVNFLMGIDCDFWELMDIQSGDEFLNKDGSFNSIFEAFCKTIKNELEKAGIKKVSRKVYETLEDKNYHTLNKALEVLGLVA